MVHYPGHVSLYPYVHIYFIDTLISKAFDCSLGHMAFAVFVLIFHIDHRNTLLPRRETLYEGLRPSGYLEHSPAVTLRFVTALA